MSPPVAEVVGRERAVRPRDPTAAAKTHGATEPRPRRLSPKQAERQRELEVVEAVWSSIPDENDEAPPGRPPGPTGPPSRPPVRPPLAILGERDERSYHAPNVDAAMARLRGHDVRPREVVPAQPHRPGAQKTGCLPAVRTVRLRRDGTAVDDIRLLSITDTEIVIEIQDRLEPATDDR